MTWKETLIRYRIPSLVILILPVTGFFDSLCTGGNGSYRLCSAYKDNKHTPKKWVKLFYGKRKQTRLL